MILPWKFWASFGLFSALFNTLIVWLVLANPAPPVPTGYAPQVEVEWGWVPWFELDRWQWWRDNGGLSPDEQDALDLLDPCHTPPIEGIFVKW